MERLLQNFRTNGGNKMKKLLIGLFLFILICFPLSRAFAATGTVTVGTPKFYTVPTLTGTTNRAVITVTWTAGNGTPDHLTPATALGLLTKGLGGWYLYQVETVPGGTQSAATAITLVDSNSFDQAGGKLSTLSASSPQLWNIGTSTFGYPLVTGDWTFTVSGNTVNSAAGTAILIFTAN